MLDSLKDPIRKSDELVFFWLFFRVAGTGTFEAVMSVSDFNVATFSSGKDLAGNSSIIMFLSSTSSINEFCLLISGSKLCTSVSDSD